MSNHSEARITFTHNNEDVSLPADIHIGITHDVHFEQGDYNELVAKALVDYPKP